MGDYQRLQTETDMEAHMPPMSINPSMNKVYYTRPMSALHKTNFIASIMFCVALVVFFLWGIPSDWYQCSYDQNESTSWDKTLAGLELKGRMHLVRGTLIAILKGAKWGQSPARFTSSDGGVVALFGKDGNEIYWKRLEVMPRYIDCSILDLIVNDVKACLIVGEDGYMAAFDPVSGLIIWNITAQKPWPQPVDVDVPILIPDVNSDDHNDLVTLSRFEKNKHRVAIISGATGVILQEPSTDNDCELVENLTYDHWKATLLYSCSSLGFPPSTKQIRLKDLKLVPNPLAPFKGMNHQVLIPDEEKMRFVKGNNSVGEHKMTVTNHGTCPNGCSVTINITDSNDKSITSFSKGNSYAMNPIPLRFKCCNPGFLLKMWSWHTPKEGIRIGDVRVELIKEQILLITFNKSDQPRIDYTSQMEIIQLCDETSCQPHLSFQTQSALIADLYNDGSQDLISYVVSYKPDNKILPFTEQKSLENWMLESHIKIVRLEDELCKLFESDSKH